MSSSAASQLNRAVFLPPTAKAIYEAATEEEREKALRYAEWLVKKHRPPNNEGLKEEQKSLRSSIRIEGYNEEMVGSQQTRENKQRNKNDVKSTATISLQSPGIAYKARNDFYETSDNNGITAHTDSDINISIRTDRVNQTTKNSFDGNYCTNTDYNIILPSRNTIQNTVADIINDDGLNVSTPRAVDMFSHEDESIQHQQGKRFSSFPYTSLEDSYTKTYNSEISTNAVRNSIKSNSINVESQQQRNSIKCAQAMVAKRWDSDDTVAHTPSTHSYKEVVDGEALRQLYRVTLMQCAEQVFSAIAYELPRDHILLTMLDAHYQQKTRVPVTPLVSPQKRREGTEGNGEAVKELENYLSNNNNSPRLSTSATIPIPPTASQVSIQTAWLRVGEVIKEHLYSVQSLQYHSILSDLSALRRQLEEHRKLVGTLEEENRVLREDRETERHGMRDEIDRLKKAKNLLVEARQEDEHKEMLSSMTMGILAEREAALEHQNEKMRIELKSIREKWHFEVKYLNERASIISECQNDFTQTLFSWSVLKEMEHCESVAKVHKMYQDRISLMIRSKEIFDEASDEVHRVAIRHKETPVNSHNVSLANTVYAGDWLSFISDKNCVDETDSSHVLCKSDRKPSTLT